MDETKLEMFAFDVLGDIIPIRAYTIIRLSNNGYAILVNTARIGVPIDMVITEWNNSKKGTEFEGINIHTC